MLSAVYRGCVSGLGRAERARDSEDVVSVGDTLPQGMYARAFALPAHITLVLALPLPVAACIVPLPFLRGNEPLRRRRGLMWYDILAIPKHMPRSIPPNGPPTTTLL